MDFELGKSQKDIQKAAREFAKGEFDKELALELDRKHEFPRKIWQKAAKLGFIGVHYPETYSGQGLGVMENILIAEEFCARDSGIGSAVILASFAAECVLRFGSEELKQKFLPAVAEGKMLSAGAFTESGHGSDITALDTLAVRHGNEWIINGTKTFITNGPICDYVIAVAYTDPSKRGVGINLFIVEKGAPGFTVARKLHKVGNWAAETGELVFEDCRVPAINMIGEKQGGGFDQIADTLISGRITYGARCTGTAQAAYELTMKYAAERVQFGQPIIKYQNTKFKLAEMATNIEIMRTFTYRIAWEYDQGRKVRKEAAMVKLFCAETLQKILADSMQIHGGYGYMMEYPIQRFWRDGRLFTITEGTSEIQRLIIAKEIGC